MLSLHLIVWDHSWCCDFETKNFGSARMEWNRIGSARLHTVVDAYKIQCSICFYVPIPQCVNLVLDSSRFDCLIYCLNEKCGICCDSKMCVFADEIRFDYKFYFCVMSSLVFLVPFYVFSRLHFVRQSTRGCHFTCTFINIPFRRLLGSFSSYLFENAENVEFCCATSGVRCRSMGCFSNLHIVNKFSFIHSYCAIHISKQRFLSVVVLFFSHFFCFCFFLVWIFMA